MLGLLRIGPGHQNPELRVLRTGVPDLLAVDDPFVAVKHCSRRKASKVGTGTRLGKQLAPDLGAAHDARHESVELLGRSVGHQGRGDEEGGDALGRPVGADRDPRPLCFACVVG